MLPSSNLLVTTSVVFLSASLLFRHGVWASQLQEMEKPGKKTTLQHFYKIESFHIFVMKSNLSNEVKLREFSWLNFKDFFAKKKAKQLVRYT